jgi:protein SCO1/2
MKAFLLAASLLVLVSCIKPSPLPVMGQIPQFQLISQTGQPFDSASLDGHVWVADFIFTTCTGPCPMMSAQMRQLQNATA